MVNKCHLKIQFVCHFLQRNIFQVITVTNIRKLDRPARPVPAGPTMLYRKLIKTTTSSNQNKKAASKNDREIRESGRLEFRIRVGRTHFFILFNLFFFENPIKSLGSMEKIGYVVKPETHIFAFL